jgi:hypothetical protein
MSKVATLERLLTLLQAGYARVSYIQARYARVSKAARVLIKARPDLLYELND